MTVIAGGKCPECGAAIPADSPAGFCAQCLLSLGLGSATEDSAPSPIPEDRGLGAATEGSLTEKPGDRIGRYRLLEEIGHGGCGVVYMAEQAEPVRRKVALKVIKLGMDTKQVVARFEAERQALALMDHPNIAKIYDAGVTDAPLPPAGHPRPVGKGEGQGERSAPPATGHSSLITSAGRPYFVMELVGGIKITDYCDENRLTTRQRLDLFIQVCRAIQHAHQKGIIHRDIKPSNVLVATQDGAPVPKVIDFGIAKATQGRLTDQTLFTAFEQFLGTPAYMSPEQTQLGSLDVDTRSDIYSLGVLLYELLTGRTPFDTKELIAAGLDGMRRTIREVEPVKPSTRLTQERVARSAAPSKSALYPPHTEIDRDLDWIVMKCLEKDRARRYATANGLAADLQRHLNCEPVVARPPSKFYEFQKTVRRHKFGFAATAAIIIVLAIGATISTWQAVRATRSEREQHRLLEEVQAAKHDATEKLWAAYLAEARALRVSGKAGRRFESLEAIRNAAAIRPSLELRNEAIASLVLPDMRLVGEKNFSRERRKVCANVVGDHYALTDDAGMVSIRRLADDFELARLSMIGSSRIWPRRFSPDGKVLCVYDREGRLQAWDWGKPAVLIDAPLVKGGDFSPDGKRLANWDGTSIVIHDLENGGEHLIPLGSITPPNSLSAVNFGPSDHLIVGWGTNVHVLDASSGEVLKTLHHANLVHRVAWHPGGRYLAATCVDSFTYLWDALTGERLKLIQIDQAVSLGFNHGGDLLVSSGWDGRTRLWEFPACRQLVSTYKSGNVIGFSPDDRTLVLHAWDDSAIHWFEVAATEVLRTVHEREHGSSSPGGAAFFNATGQLLAYPTAEGVSLWVAQKGRVHGVVEAESVFPIGFDARNENLLAVGPTGFLRYPVIDAALATPGNLGPPILVQGGKLEDGVVSADGKYCVLDGENRWSSYRTDSHTKLANIQIEGDEYWPPALSPDGVLLAAGRLRAPGVRVWITRTGERIKEMPTDHPNPDSRTGVAFSPDGRYLVTATAAEYSFWEVGEWSLAQRIPQQTGNDFPASMAFSRDGTIFAGTHSRNVVRLHDAATGLVLADLEAPNSRFVSSLCFNPDGTQLAACESRDALRVWDLRMIREELAGMGLDWELPHFPPKAPDAPGPPAATGDPREALGVSPR